MANPIEAALRKTLTQGVMKLAQFNRERMAEPATPNPFITGLNAPMGEELTLADLQVTGTIPAALEGRYLRIGPNPVAPPKAASHHWFVGDGMVHGVRLQGGRALWYRNRWIRSTAVSQALGEAPAPGPRQRSDTVNTTVLGHAGKTWALVEAGGYPVELDDDLSTVALLWNINGVSELQILEYPDYTLHEPIPLPGTAAGRFGRVHRSAPTRADRSAIRLRGSPIRSGG